MITNFLDRLGRYIHHEWDWAYESMKMPLALFGIWVFYLAIRGIVDVIRDSRKL